MGGCVSPRVAVLGAGIMGCSVALFLARRGAQVTLVDAARRPFARASRWNEGKIHLGYLYSADPSLATAEHVLPGGLVFRPLVESLVACSLAPAITPADDVYVCHRQSVVLPDAMQAYMRRVDERVRTHPDAGCYLADVSHAASCRLDAAELAALTASPDIVAGFRVPERSVETTWVADRFVSAIDGEKRIAQCMDMRISAVRPLGQSPAGQWCVDTSAGGLGSFDFVVNALWEGRMGIDRTAGLAPGAVWSNRYRQSLFLRTTHPVQTPCVVIATGPFGDVKNYNTRDFYLSWYPDGLRVESSELVPPEPDAATMPDPLMLAESIFDHLQAYLPWIARVRSCVERSAIEGGWVFAAGRGSLSDPSSTLHRRSDYGVARVGNYVSVDTGKYSTAPWLARSIARELF